MLPRLPRRDIWHGDDMAGDGELRANWNKALVEELAASCYCRVLTAAKEVLGGGAAYEALWPTGPTAPDSMWRGLVDSLMLLTRPLPLLRSRLNGGVWVSPQACLVWAAGGLGGEEQGGGVGGGNGAGGDDVEQRALAEILLAEKVFHVFGVVFLVVWIVPLKKEYATVVIYRPHGHLKRRYACSTWWLYATVWMS